MSTLTNALERIMSWLKIYKPELADSFLPSLTLEEIRAGEEKIGFLLPKEIYELYQWQNGMTKDSDSLFFPSIGFIPFNEAIAFPKLVRYSKKSNSSLS